MSRYFRPVILDNNQPSRILAWVHPSKYGADQSLLGHSWIGNRFMSAFESLISRDGPYYGNRVVWAGDTAPATADNGSTNVFYRCTASTTAYPSEKFTGGQFIVNHSKKLFIDKKMIPSSKDGAMHYLVHPIPLLTYQGDKLEDLDDATRDLLGIWANDVITVDEYIPGGFVEFVFPVAL